MCFFFMENDKANERSGHLMVSDHRRPRPRATQKEVQVHCRPLRWFWRYPCHIDLETPPRVGHSTVKPCYAASRCGIEREAKKNTLKWALTVALLGRNTLYIKTYIKKSASRCIPNTAGKAEEGRGNLVLIHSFPHFPPNSGGITCWVAELNAAA